MSPLESEHVTLRSGIRMPVMGLGVFRSGAGEGTRRSVRAALEAGYRHIAGNLKPSSAEHSGRKARPMRINQKTVLVSGASRGIGRALVDEALARGASRVFAGARSEAALDSLARIDSRVQPLKLDVTRQEDIEAAAGTVGKLDLLINNAGSLTGYSLLSSQRKAVEADFAVNFWGALEVTKAFVAKLEASQGAVLNVLTLVSMASMPAIGGYSASKAAAWSMTQALRAELSARSIQVFAAYPGSVDTDMIRAFEMPKTDPSVVAANMLAAVESGTIDSFPDPMSEQAGSAWLGDPRSLEAMFAKM